MNQKDLVGNRWAAILLWGLPLIAFVFGFFTGSILRTVLWTAAFSVMGVACLVNASRCGRTHCYFTGPFFLLVALASLTYGLEMLPLGLSGWVWIGISAGIGSILSYLPEWCWGNYRV